MNEYELIDQIRGKAWSHKLVSRSIGDDAAIVDTTTDQQFVVTADMLMDKVHFDVSSDPPQLIGRKCLAVNLSDCAAMAAEPMAAFISLALPRTLSDGWVGEFLRGITDLAWEYETEIAGGDTNVWNGPLVVNITLLGQVSRGKAVLRQGAKPGDRIFVTGPLGGSRGSKQFTFVPRVKEALELNRQFQPTAMVDLSDGLATDLRHLCRASGCGAVIEADAIPISSAVESKDPLRSAMTDGEDFELCFCLPPGRADALKKRSQILSCAVYDIGEITAGDKLVLRDLEGHTRPLDWYGYVHG
jgi:thiamine-monophosphate kinase